MLTLDLLWPGTAGSGLCEHLFWFVWADVAPWVSWPSVVLPSAATNWEYSHISQKCSGRSRQSSCQGNYGLQEYSRCSRLWILTSLMRMLIQSEQLCPWGGLLMIFQIVFIDYFEQRVSEFWISRITNSFFFNWMGKGDRVGLCMAQLLFLRCGL